jgi:hypothetical protein
VIYMAWENPVTTWGQAGKTVPVAGDFNRIEGNTQYLKDEVDSHKAEDASTTAKGHVQLSSSTSSTSTSLAATASAVKAVNDEAKAYTDAHEQKAAPHSGHETPAGAQAKANTAEANAKAYTDAHEQKAAPHSGHETPAGAQAKADAAAGAVQAELDAHKAESATTSQKGHVQLTSSISSTSTSLAATASAVSTVNNSLNNHISSIGTTANYGHCKTINNLTQSSHVNGNALSAYQGKVLNDKFTAGFVSGSISNHTVENVAVHSIAIPLPFAPWHSIKTHINIRKDTSGSNSSFIHTLNIVGAKQYFWDDYGGATARTYDASARPSVIYITTSGGVGIHCAGVSVSGSTAYINITNNGNRTYTLYSIDYWMEVL